MVQYGTDLSLVQDLMFILSLSIFKCLMEETIAAGSRFWKTRDAIDIFISVRVHK